MHTGLTSSEFPYILFISLIKNGIAITTSTEWLTDLIFFFSLNFPLSKSGFHLINLMQIFFYIKTKSTSLNFVILNSKTTCCNTLNSTTNKIKKKLCSFVNRHFIPPNYYILFFSAALKNVHNLFNNSLSQSSNRQSFEKVMHI